MEASKDVGVSLLDNLSKLVSCFGVVLGVAYVFGLVNNYFFFSSLDATWIVGLMDAQVLIKEGLPSALILVLVTVVIFMLFENLEQLSFATSVLIPIVSLVISLLGMLLGLLGVDTSSVFYSFALRVVPVTAASICFVWSFRMYAEGYKGKKVAGCSIFGVVLTFFLIPYLQYGNEGRDLKWASKGVSLVIGDKKQVLGVLVGTISGKYVILACRSNKEISLSEITSQLSVRPSAGDCT